VHTEGYFKGLKDFRIYYQRWSPDGDSRAVLLVAHGFAEHSGRYGNLVSYFVPRSWTVYIPDHRGHGKSEGERVQVDRFSDYVDDLKAMFDVARKENPAKKVFLVGHSMGSAISLFYAARYQDQLAGLITSGGGINKPGEAPPTRPVGQTMDTGFLSHDPEVVKAYVNDPLVYHGPIPSRLGGMMSDIAEAVPLIKLPALIMAGDAVADGARSRTLFESLGSKDKTLKLYPGLRHEIFNEPEHLQVMADLAAWLDMHM
jgi:alpha-beta hydrolase superfamily lysophospholipase